MSHSKPECSYCGKKAVFRCACCKLTTYCSKECSSAHYAASHKELCRRWREADEEIVGAEMRDQMTNQIATDLAPAVFVNGRYCSSSMLQAQCDLMTVCAEINTPASLQAAMTEAENVVKSRSDNAFTKDIFIMPWLYLLDPHPDNVRLCYTIMRCDLLGTTELGDILETYISKDPVPAKSRCSFIKTLYHTVPHMIVKCLVAAEAAAFLDRLDAILMCSTSVWRNTVVIANIANFLWPQHHCLARTALAERKGKQGMGTIGDLREACAALTRRHAPKASERGHMLLKLLLNAQAPQECEGQPVSAVPFSAPPESTGEVYTIAKMYHPVVHNPRVPLMAQVRELIAGMVKEG